MLNLPQYASEVKVRYFSSGTSSTVLAKCHSSKAFTFSISGMLLILSDVNALHPVNALVPIKVTLAKLRLCKAVQPLKAVSLILKEPCSGRVTVFRLSQPSKQL